MIVIGHYGSGCFPQPAALEVNLIRRPAAKRLVRAVGVVEAEVVSQAGPGLGRRFVGLQVNLLVFHAAPQPLDEHVVDHCWHYRVCSASVPRVQYQMPPPAGYGRPLVDRPSEGGWKAKLVNGVPSMAGNQIGTAFWGVGEARGPSLPIHWPFNQAGQENTGVLYSTELYPNWRALTVGYSLIA